MQGDLDIDVSKIVIEDDASQLQDEVPFEARRPKYVRNKLPTGGTGLSAAERVEMGKMFDLKRPGFLDVIKSILR